MGEFEKVVKDLDMGFKDFKERHNARIEKIERYLDGKEIEMKSRSGVTVSAGYFASSPEEKTFGEYLRQGEARMDPYERKTLRLGDSTAGGYLAPTTYHATIIEKLTEFSPVRSIAWVMPTSGPAVEIPKQTGAFSANWVSEIGTRAETTGLTFGLEHVPVHEMVATVVISRQLLEDSGPNLEDYLAAEFGRQFARCEGTSFLTGNTTGQPEGILQNANITSANSGNNTDLTPDGLISLVYALPSEYRRGAKFLMARGTIEKCRKMKSNDADYLWQPGLAAGQPDRLLGYEVVEAPDVPAVANAAYPVIFGDFKRAYLVADRTEVQIQRLVETYASTGCIGFQARRRVGGQVVLAEAIKKLLVAA